MVGGVSVGGGSLCVVHSSDGHLGVGTYAGEMFAAIQKTDR